MTDLIDTALSEDIGEGDLTTRAVVPDGAQAKARISQKAHPGWSRVYARVEEPGWLCIGDPVTLDAGGSMASPRQRAANGGTEPVPRLSIRRTGTVDVACAAAEAFAYFTPDGERLWVPDFDPEYLHPLFTTALGLVMVAISALLLVIAYIAMIRIVKIEV